MMNDDDGEDAHARGRTQQQHQVQPTVEELRQTFFSSLRAIADEHFEDWTLALRQHDYDATEKILHKARSQLKYDAGWNVLVEDENGSDEDARLLNFIRRTFVNKSWYEISLQRFHRVNAPLRQRLVADLINNMLQLNNWGEVEYCLDDIRLYDGIGDDICESVRDGLRHRESEQRQQDQRAQRMAAAQGDMIENVLQGIIRQWGSEQRQQDQRAPRMAAARGVDSRRRRRRSPSFGFDSDDSRRRRRRSL